MNKFRCYGSYKKNDEKCSDCELKEWCTEANNPTPSPFNRQYDYISCVTTDNKVIPAYEIDEETLEALEYTRADVLDILRESFHVYKDVDKFIITKKLEFPNITLSDLGEMAGVSKQAIDMRIESICRDTPAFEPVLRNRVQRPHCILNKSYTVDS